MAILLMNNWVFHFFCRTLYPDPSLLNTLLCHAVPCDVMWCDLMCAELYCTVLCWATLPVCLFVHFPLTRRVTIILSFSSQTIFYTSFELTICVLAPSAHFGRIPIFVSIGFRFYFFFSLFWIIYVSAYIYIAVFRIKFLSLSLILSTISKIFD